MNHEKTNQTILQIKKLEKRAKVLQYQLDQIRNRWEKKFEQVKDSDEWKNSCNEFNTCIDYNFADVLS